LAYLLLTLYFFLTESSLAMKSFYRSFNSIFGKLGRLASEEVILHLVNVQCVPAVIAVWLGCMPYKHIGQAIS